MENFSKKQLFYKKNADRRKHLCYNTFPVSYFNRIIPEVKNIRTLFVSDLDGTLLNSKKKIPEEGQKIFNSQRVKGQLFTIATARSAASAQEYYEALGLALPAVLMNGVFVYDFHRKVYLHKNPIPREAACEALAELSKRKIWPFLFTLEGEELCAEFVRLNNPEMESFYLERKDKSYKRFGPVERFADHEEVCMVYISVIDTEEKLRPVFEWARKHPELSASLYRDNYSDHWYLEVYSVKADKAAGIAWLKQYTGADRVVVFGDNYNDIQMLKSADEGYVVTEAPESVKAYATGVIGSSEESAVPRFIEAYPLK